MLAYALISEIALLVGYLPPNARAHRHLHAGRRVAVATQGPGQTYGGANC